MQLTIDIPAAAVTNRLVRKINSHVGTVNASKFRRHKRGKLFLADVTCCDGRLVLRWKPVVRYAYRASRKIRRLKVYDYGNHAGLVAWLKTMAS